MHEDISPNRKHEGRSERYTVGRLLTKRATVLGDLSVGRGDPADLAALDRVLALYGYAGDLSTQRPVVTRHWLFRRGELSRLILDILREANEPLTVGQIADRVMQRKGVAPDLRARVWKTCHVTLTKRLKPKGAAQRYKARKGEWVWKTVIGGQDYDDSAF